MYNNDFNSGSGAGDNTSGVFSGAEDAVSQTQSVIQQTQSTTEGSTQSAVEDGTREYSTYQTDRSDAVIEPLGNADIDKKSKENKEGGFLRKVLLSISLGLFFGLFAGLGFYAVQEGTGMMKQTNGEATEIPNIQTEREVAEDVASGIIRANTNNITVVSSDISNVVEEVMPAMVSIVNSYTETGTFFGQTYTQEQEASGSGIIVSENDTELLVVTNYHVVADSSSLYVTFIDGSEAEANIKGLDREMDLAVIAISLDSLDEETKDAISIATLGGSDDLKLGEPVIAIGNALGYGQSVTKGIISALDREITLEDGSVGIFIQTDAAINPGNSGGALLNINGEVIGINSNKIGAAIVEGMGYAIPISSANPIIADLMERRTRNEVRESKRGYIGISLQEVTGQISQMYNMPTGIYVVSVEEGSAAEAAGIMKGDIITKFDGEKISSYDDLQKVLRYYEAGDTTKITVMRPESGEYVEYELEITLGRRPSDR